MNSAGETIDCPHGMDKNNAVAKHDYYILEQPILEAFCQDQLLQVFDNAYGKGFDFLAHQWTVFDPFQNLDGLTWESIRGIVELPVRKVGQLFSSFIQAEENAMRIKRQGNSDAPTTELFSLIEKYNAINAGHPEILKLNESIKGGFTNSGVQLAHLIGEVYNACTESGLDTSTAFFPSVRASLFNLHREAATGNIAHQRSGLLAQYKGNTLYDVGIQEGHLVLTGADNYTKAVSDYLAEEDGQKANPVAHTEGCVAVKVLIPNKYWQNYRESEMIPLDLAFTYFLVDWVEARCH
jgi:hypothetical protein